MQDQIALSIVEQYKLAGFLLICFVAVIAFLGKYFIAQIDKKDVNLTKYMESTEVNRLAAEVRYQTSIEKVTDKFEGAIKSLSSETKETFGHLTDAIDKLREEMHRGKQN